MGINVAAAVRLMLVTDDRFLPEDRLLRDVARAVDGGVTSVQLRLKSLGPRELVRLARAMVAALPVPVLVNDRPDVAIAAGACGVHLGPDDLPVSLARQAWPDAGLVGASVGSAEEVAGGAAADYWGVGPWRTTGTKPDAGRAIRADGFRAIARLARGRPCIAIGGVRPEDVRAVLAAGGSGVAVVTGILAASDVAAAAAAYAEQYG